MERHNEIVRQWKILTQISTARDWTIPRLAREHKKHRKTIERDLEALQLAGFPIYDERDGRTNYWRMDDVPFKKLKDTGFTFAELCAFYVNRSRFAGCSGSVVEAEFQGAMEKLKNAFNPKMKAYLDRLATVVTWADEPGRRGNGKAAAQFHEEILRAILDYHQLEMEYHSLSSRRQKTYVVEPYRVAHGHGGIYLYAFVPAYGEMRTFALQRIRSLKRLEKTFNPTELKDEPFRRSLGAYTGTPISVTLQFSPSVAPYIDEWECRFERSRRKLPDGAVELTMEVCNDLALRSWILSYGHQVRVVSPTSLAEQIYEELAEAREQYAPRMSFDLPQPVFDDRQYWLPLPDRGDSRWQSGPHGRKREGGVRS